MNRYRQIWITLAGVGLLAFAFLFLDFVGDTKVYYAVSPDERADAIVVLTGGKGRAEEGLALLRKARAELLILSGVNVDADADSIFFYNKLSDDESEKIMLEKTSRSTYENAVEVGRISRQKGLKSILLITSGYHMKRADFIFRRVLPPDIEIKNHVAQTPNFDETRWWAGRSLGLLMVEFLKFQWYAVRFAF